MDGSVIILALFGLAVFMFVKAAAIRVADTRLRARLVPVQARVVDPGTSPQTTIFVSEDSNGQRTERRDTSYTATYEYEVAGRRHTGKHEDSSPVFPAAPRTATVYYDRDDPSVSRVSATVPDERPKLFAMFGIVVAVVATVILFISAGAPVAPHPN